MNRRLLTILLSAFLVAILSAFVVYRLVGSRIAAAKTQSTTTIVAAAQDMPIGSMVSAPNLTTIQVVGAAPPGTIADARKVIGRGVISMIYKGEPIFENRLATEGSGAGLAATIKPGMRAIAVRVDQVVGVAGFVTPGMRVDMLVSGEPPSGERTDNSGPEMRTLLQNLEVLSAGTDIQKDAEGKPRQVPVVNLLVTPEQAQVIALASQTARIQLVLRNPLDTKVADVQATTVANLYASGNAPKAKPRFTGPIHPIRKKPETFNVTVINGSRKSEQKFEVPEGKK